MTSSGGAPALMSHQSFQSQYSSYSHNSARDTQNSAATSTTTLFGNQPSNVFTTPSSTPVNGGPEASNNVLNKRADKDTSLFQRCVNLRSRLLLIPGFERWIVEEDAEAGADDDPVSLLWRMFRKGYPLMDVYNALNPNVRLFIDESKITEKNRAKSAAFKFIRACVEELKFPADECPILSDLFGDDTTGFVKVDLLRHLQETLSLTDSIGHQCRQPCAGHVGAGGNHQVRGRSFG